MPERNKILMDFIADAVKGCRSDTYKNQQFLVVFEWQGFIGPEKQDAQKTVRPKMQEFI